MSTEPTRSKMLDAFIKQTYEPHGGIEAFESKREEVYKKVADIKDEWNKEAKEILNRPQDIVNHVNVPTKLKVGELDDKPRVHSHFANYDHSLEINRLTALREKYNYVEPESTQIMEIDHTDIPTEPIEDINPSDIPNLNGIFDNIFGE